MSEKHFKNDQPRHDPKVEEAIVELRKIEIKSRNMGLGIKALLSMQNEMLQYGFFLTEVESNYRRSWKMAEAERKARYYEVFFIENKEKIAAAAKESTNIIISPEKYDEIYAEWKFKSVQRMCEIAKDSRDAIKDRIKSAKSEKIEGRNQT